MLEANDTVVAKSDLELPSGSQGLVGKIVVQQVVKSSHRSAQFKVLHVLKSQRGVRAL